MLSPCEEQSISKMLCRKFMMNCPFYVLNKSYVFFSSKFFTIQHLKIFLEEQVKGTNLLWFGDNNNYELKITGGKTEQNTHFLVDTLTKVMFL